MTIRLRQYQQELQYEVGQSLRRVKRVMLQSAPGSGKTCIAASIASAFASRSSEVWFICHRAELVEQASKTFFKFGLQHSFIAAGYPQVTDALVKICSIDTLKNRLEVLKAPRIALVDEAHHGGAVGWAEVIDWLVANGAQVIGLSGTPQRHDGAGLDKHFDEIVLGPTVAWLMAEGYLSQYKIFAPSAPDMQGVRKQMGEYNKKDAADRMGKPKLTGDMISHWLKHAKGMRTIGFAVNVKHSKYLVDEFNAAGIRAAHLDSGTKKKDRKRIIEMFADGELDIIWNVALFGEGFDLSAIAQRDITIDAIIDAAPTMSLPWYLQKIMRPMRPMPGKIAIILDHAGNSNLHGFPEDDRNWSLESSGISKKAANDNGPPPPVTCDGCFQQIRRPLPPCCPSCGKKILADVKLIEVVDGELPEVTEAMKRERRGQQKREEWEAKDLQALVALGMKRGMKNPQHWAFKKWSNSKWRN